MTNKQLLLGSIIIVKTIIETSKQIIMPLLDEIIVEIIKYKAFNFV